MYGCVWQLPLNQHDDDDFHIKRAKTDAATQNNWPVCYSLSLDQKKLFNTNVRTAFLSQNAQKKPFSLKRSLILIGSVVASVRLLYLRDRVQGRGKVGREKGNNERGRKEKRGERGREGNCASPEREVWLRHSFSLIQNTCSNERRVCPVPLHKYEAQ